MTARSQARDDAVRVLLSAGWDTERIRQGLGITEELAARLVRQIRQPEPPASFVPGCCRRDTLGHYCDAPVAMPGAVYCVRHTHGGVWAS